MRARTLSFALLGLMTAVGLGLVMFISHLGWPNILGGSIPGLPTKHSALHSRVIASRPTTPNQVLEPGSRLKPAVAPKPSGTEANLAASGLPGSSKAVAPSPPPSHGNDQPSGNGAPGGSPSSQPPAAAPAPAPSPAPVASSPPSTVTSVAGSPQRNGKGSVNGKGGGHGEGEGYSKAASSSATKASGYHQASHAPAVSAEPPSPVAAGPAKDESSPPSGETGDGYGHAYGHNGK